MAYLKQYLAYKNLTYPWSNFKPPNPFQPLIQETTYDLFELTLHHLQSTMGTNTTSNFLVVLEGIINNVLQIPKGIIYEWENCPCDEIL